MARESRTRSRGCHAVRAGRRDGSSCGCRRPRTACPRPAGSPGTSSATAACDVDTAVLLVSEVVTNAVLHAPQRRAPRRRGPRRRPLRVEVRDSSPMPPRRAQLRGRVGDRPRPAAARPAGAALGRRPGGRGSGARSCGSRSASPAEAAWESFADACSPREPSVTSEPAGLVSSGLRTSCDGEAGHRCADAVRAAGRGRRGRRVPGPRAAARRRVGHRAAAGPQPRGGVGACCPATSTACCSTSACRTRTGLDGAARACSSSRRASRCWC